MALNFPYNKGDKVIVNICDANKKWDDAWVPVRIVSIDRKDEHVSFRFESFLDYDLALESPEALRVESLCTFTGIIYLFSEKEISERVGTYEEIK